MANRRQGSVRDKVEQTVIETVRREVDTLRREVAELRAALAGPQ